MFFLEMPFTGRPLAHPLTVYSQDSWRFSVALCWALSTISRGNGTSSDQPGKKMVSGSTAPARTHRQLSFHCHASLCCGRRTQLPNCQKPCLKLVLSFLLCSSCLSHELTPPRSKTAHSSNTPPLFWVFLFFGL